MQLDDDGKLMSRYRNKIHNARKENIKCLLTLYEYCMLLKMSGLKSSNLGFKGDKYVLARYNDTGNYEWGNCRFITHKENMHEQKISEKLKLLHKKFNLKGLEAIKNISKEDLSIRIKKGLQNSEKMKQIREEQKRKKEIKESLKDKRYSGIHNSQYGTFWITNGYENRKWKYTKGPLPEGFYKGRVTNI